MDRPPPPAPPPVAIAMARPWVFLSTPMGGLDHLFLETRAQQAREIWVYFGLPPHLVQVQHVMTWPPV